MALATYKIDRFFGIDQSVDENSLSEGFTADAVNMNTDDGNLTVAKGFTKKFAHRIPGTGTVHKCVVFRHSIGDIYVAFAGDSIYVSNGGAWLTGYTFDPGLNSHSFDTLEVNIGATDYLLIGNGETGLIKYDGESFTDFGSAELNSNHPVRYLAMYKNRLFAAGDPNYPNRLYWSQLPGGDRSIENWGPCDASVNVEGGHVEVGLFDSDPIVAITALPSQILIFKKNSVYRLYGDKPSNFTLEEIEAITECTAHTSIVHYADVAYFMTDSGLYVFDGVSVHRSADADRIFDIVKNSVMSDSRGAKTRNKLYFTIKHDGEDAILEYDRSRRTYMLRNGFSISDIFSRDNTLYLVNSARYVYEFDKGNTYDGVQINAHWKTPLTDMGEKSVIKKPCELYLRGDGINSGTLTVELTTDGITDTQRIRGLNSFVKEVPLKNEGRTFSMKISNEAGSSFSIKGGLEMSMTIKRRCV